ncbi:MAG: HAD family hydrolase [Candidatus Electrothrix sp. AUS1_2]|nr:HAD family hydrolase [Candidatus Electrothrix sp. AUS1_2]
MSTSRFKAIIFDLDDTLYPERQYVLSGFQAVAEWAEQQLGISQQDAFGRLRSLFEQGVRNNTFNLFLEENNLHDDNLITEMIKVYRCHQPSLTPFPDVPDLLEYLSKNFLLGLISDGYLDVQRKKWNALALPVVFQAVIFSDQWGREFWKPSQRPFREALEQLETTAAAAGYIGDNPKKDFLGAKEIGMYTIMVQRKGGEYSHLPPPSQSYAADMTVSNLSQLKKIVA